ncbi:MAG: hypothetical protein LLG04_18930 [Parachlamydia sp.]|jgi:hypothetical protein|nr:hypothetical protein [Parachlamydia sp.]
MNNTAQTTLSQNRLSGHKMHEVAAPSLTSIPRDEFYEREIFHLEAQISRLEFLLMITEEERNIYKDAYKTHKSIHCA